MFPYLPFQKDLTVSCMGVALQTVIPKMIHKKITAFFELIKPLVEFKVNQVIIRIGHLDTSDKAFLKYQPI